MLIYECTWGPGDATKCHGYAAYLLSRDTREYHLSDGASATIAEGEGTALLNSSSEDVVFPHLKPGDQIKVISDPLNDPAGQMRQVSVAVESGEHKGLTGNVPRLYLRPSSW